MNEKKENAPWEDLPEETENNSDDADLMDPEEIRIPEDKLPLIDEIAVEYVGFWNRLVSQTNWEKGKVINTWRNRLIDAGLPRTVYSDDAIAKRIGNVSGQHVGRLRRVFEQFGESDRFPNLYWSHYQAALDWEDANDWLSKANEENLSVASMRIARWEKYGAPADRKPKENEIVDAEPDEDVNPFNDSDTGFVDVGSSIDNNVFGEDENKSGKENKKEKKDRELGPEKFEGDDEAWKSHGAITSDVLNSLNKLGSLPSDLGDAFESLKIAILSHKYTKWDEVSADTVLAYLSAMKALILSEDPGK